MEGGGGFGLSLLGNQGHISDDQVRRQDEQRIISEIVNSVASQNVQEAYSIPVKKSTPSSTIVSVVHPIRKQFENRRGSNKAGAHGQLHTRVYPKQFAVHYNRAATSFGGSSASSMMDPNL